MSPERKRRILILASVAWPLERRRSDLEHWDSSRGKSPVDVFEQSDLNPFFVVRKSLSNMWHAGALGDMGALYDVVPEAHHGSLCDKTRGFMIFSAIPEDMVNKFSKKCV